MDTFLSTLLTMSVTAALVAGIVMLLRLVLRPLPRWITCALWGVVFLRMICPVGLSLPVSLVPQAITSGAYVQHLLPAEPGPAQETVPVQDTPRPGRAHPFRRRRDPTGPSRASGYSTARLAHRGVGHRSSSRPALGRSLLRQTPPAGGGGRAGGERGL